MTNCRPLLNNYKVHSFDFTKETYFGIAYETLCGKMGLFGFLPDWKETEEEVTCKTCFSVLQKETRRSGH